MQIIQSAGFPTGVENMGGVALQNLMGGGLSQYMGGAWEEGFKYCRKIPVKEFI